MNPEGFYRSLRVSHLLSRGCQVLQEAFRDRYQRVTGKAWEDTPENGQPLLHGVETLANDWPTFADTVSNGQLHLWDLTILSHALKALGEEPLHLGDDWKEKLVLIRRLVKARNEDAHSTKCLSNREFIRLFTTIRNALSEIGFDDEEMEAIRTAGFTNPYWTIGNPGALLLLRLNVLLHRGTQVVSQAFIRRFKEVTEKEWDGKHQCVKNFIETIGQKTYNNAWRRRKQKIRSGDVSQWDISLLADFIKSLEAKFFLNTGKSWEDTKIIEELVAVRNKQAHILTTVLTKSHFEDIFNCMKTALIALGCDEEEIERIRTAPSVVIRGTKIDLF